MDENMVREVIEALLKAGLCVCEARFIGPCHPAEMPSIEYVIGRVEESGGFGTN